MKAFKKMLQYVMIAMLPLMAACGGGSDGANGSLNLAVSSPAVDAGDAIVATATLTTAKAGSLNGLDVNFSYRDNTGSVISVSGETNVNGVATVQLPTNAAITEPDTVVVIAEVSDIKSNSIPVTINPVVLDVNLGALSIGLSSATMNAGSALTATATFTHPYVQKLGGVPIVFSTDHPEIFDSVTINTTADGLAVAPLLSKNAITSPTTVSITATTGDLKATTTVLVKPATLSLIAPANASFSVQNAPAGAVMRWVVSGASVLVSDSNGNPIPNQSIKVSVQTIVNKNPGDKVVFFPSPGVEVIAPPGTINLMTDSTGKAIIPVAIDVQLSSPGGQHVITVVWSVTTSVNGNNLVGYGSSMFTAINTI